MSDDTFTDLAASIAKRCAAMMEGMPLDLVAAAAGNLAVGTILQMRPEDRLPFLDAWLACVGHAVRAE